MICIYISKLKGKIISVAFKSKGSLTRFKIFKLYDLGKLLNCTFSSKKMVIVTVKLLRGLNYMKSSKQLINKSHQNAYFNLQYFNNTVSHIGSGVLATRRQSWPIFYYIFLKKLFKFIYYN